MKASELTAIIAKVQQVAGDVDIVLRNAETAAETAITDLVVHLSPQTGATGGTLSIEHSGSPAPAAPDADVTAALGLATEAPPAAS